MLKNRKLVEKNIKSPSGIGWWPPISTWISVPPIRSSGPHCGECLHEVRRLLLKLILGEPLTLVQKLVLINNLIQLDTLLASVLNLCVHDSNSCGLFTAIWFDLYWCQLLDNV